MSKAEIIAELPKLSPEDRAEVRAWLDRLDNGKSNLHPTPRIRTPRLANRAQASDFIKQVTELPTNASL
jgi:hypothetical protein